MEFGEKPRLLHKMKKQNRSDNSNFAVVLGLGITGLGVIRNLGRNKIRIIGVDSDPLAITFFSKYCTQKLICRQVALNEELVEYLRSLAESINSRCVLIPAEDRYLRFVCKHKEQLERYFTFVMPDKNLCESIMNKRLFHELALRYDTPVPKTYFPQLENGGVEAIAGQIKYPCIIKPVYSKKWDIRSTLKAIASSDPDDLIDKYGRLANHNNTEVLIQEVVPGPDDQQYSLYAYFNRNAEPLISFVARKIRQYPTGFGIGTYIESAQEPDVEKMGIDFLKKIKYKGIAEVEFRKDNRDNRFKLIEINPRSWTQSTLPTRSGINMIYLAYLDAIGRFSGQILSYHTGVKWINDFLDIFSSICYIKKKELSLAEWAGSLKGMKEFAFFSYDDPAPFLYFPIYSAIKLLKDAMCRLKSRKLLQ